MNTNNRFSRHWPLFAIALLITVGSVGYLKKSVMQPQSVREIKIGAMFSLTGENANYGTRSLHGARWAVEKINQRGGLNGIPITLVIADTRSTPKDAVGAYRKLVDADKVSVIVGDIISGTTLAVAPLAQREHVLLFAPGASSPKLTEAGDFVFRNWTSDIFDGETIARYAKSKGEAKAVVIVEKTDYTMGISQAFIREFQAGGGEMLGTFEFDSNSLDFRETIEKIKGLNPSCIYVSAYSAPSGRIIRQAKEADIKSNLYATLTVDTPECVQIAGNSLEGVSFTTPALDLASEAKEVTDFVAGFETQFGDKPESAAAHAYDAMMMLASIWPNDETPNAENLKSALASLKYFPGVTGMMSMDQNGDVVKSINIKQYVNGKAVLIKTISPAK
jgi:branched-chain amino acid transport system substrate-binding protein